MFLVLVVSASSDDCTVCNEEQAIDVQLAMEGELHDCGTYYRMPWNSLSPGSYATKSVCPHLNKARWKCSCLDGSYLYYFCRECAVIRVSLIYSIIEYLPSRVRVNRDRIKSIASIRRAMRRIMRGQRQGQGLDDRY